jgi:TetR/AcrR family transcriptional regulator, transcriptional repressor for nem operon
MPRPREFDETAALDAAMQCFWRRGYEATTLRDLTEAMGLTAPSIYNAFGDKQALFGRALERYLEQTTRERLRRLEADLPPREAITRFFTEIIDHSVQDSQRKGCFLVNSALEIAPHDAKYRAIIAAQFEDIEAFFRRRIHAGQEDGGIWLNLDAADAARLLLGVLLGIRVLARAKPKREALEGVARPALALLDPPRRYKGGKR